MPPKSRLNDQCLIIAVFAAADTASRPRIPGTAHTASRFYAAMNGRGSVPHDFVNSPIPGPAVEPTPHWQRNLLEAPPLSRAIPHLMVHRSHLMKRAVAILSTTEPHRVGCV